MTSKSRALGTLTLVVGLALLTGCADEATSPSASETQMIAAFPLDRTLPALVEDTEVEALLLVDDVQIEEPTRTAVLPRGLVPVVTPATATVRRSYVGSVPVGSTVRMVFGGGTVDGHAYEVTTSMAPDLDDVMAAVSNGSLLVGGPWVDDEEMGRVLDPQFVYAVDTNEHAQSLLESGSELDAEFTLTALDTELERDQSRPDRS